jgi:hypothetical protein
MSVAKPDSGSKANASIVEMPLCSCFSTVVVFKMLADVMLMSAKLGFHSSAACFFEHDIVIITSEEFHIL